MIRFYALKDGFYDVISTCPQILDQVSKEQLDKMVFHIDMDELMNSACSFFQDSIVMEEKCLYMHHAIKEDVYRAECHLYFIQMDDQYNPFLSLLKRKYRSYFIRDFDFT